MVESAPEEDTTTRLPMVNGVVEARPPPPPREEDAMKIYFPPLPMRRLPSVGMVEVPVPPPVMGVMGLALAIKAIPPKIREAPARKEIIYFFILALGFL